MFDDEIRNSPFQGTIIAVLRRQVGSASLLGAAVCRGLDRGAELIHGGFPKWGYPLSYIISSHLIIYFFCS